MTFWTNCSKIIWKRRHPSRSSKNAIRSRSHRAMIAPRTGSRDPSTNRDQRVQASSGGAGSQDQRRRPSESDGEFRSRKGGISRRNCQSALGLGFLILSSIAPGRRRPLDFLKELVEIPSGTKQIDAVNQRAGADLRSRLQKPSGSKSNSSSNPLGENRSGKLLLATRVFQNSPKRIPRFVTLVMHADTVFEPESGFTRWNPKDAGVVNGPGVIDDKGGVVVALTGLENILVKIPRHRFLSASFRHRAKRPVQSASRICI